MLFISYARADGAAVAERLYREFLLRRMPVWRDTRSIDPYSDFSSEIERAIRAASHVIVCLTPSIAARFDSFVRREIAYAQQQRVPIIPFLAGGATATDVPVTISHLTWIDGNDISKALPELLKRVRQASDLNPPTRPTTDPWEEHLLRLLGFVVDEIDRVTLDPDALIPLRIRFPDEPLTLRLPAYTPRSYSWSAKADPPHGYKALSEAVLDRHQGATILMGEPGSGKTTSILALARELTVARLSDPTARVPIFAPLNLWAGHERMIDWLASVTGLTADRIDEVVSAGRAVILLDGLDEVSTAEGQADFLRSWVGLRSPALVTCRTDVFRRLNRMSPVPADFYNVVELEPLNDQEIREFLVHDPALTDVLDEDSGLLELVRTPIFLVLLAVGYRELPESATSLRGMDELGDVGDELFRRYFRRLYEFEVSHTGHDLPFSLEEVYLQLGRALLQHRGSAFQVFWAEEYLEIPFEFDPEFLMFLVRLRILAIGREEAYRFRHILIHHHFGYSYAASEMTNPQRHFRRAAARALGWIGDSRGTSLLLAALSDEPSVQHMAVESLGRVSSPEAIRVLLNLALGFDDDLRLHATEAIRNYAIPTVMFDELAACLKDTRWRLRLACAQALARAGDARSIPILVEALSRDSRDAEGAAGALSHILETHPAPEALGPLISAMLRGPGYVRIPAINALGALGDERARKALLSIEDNQWLELREAVDRAVRRLGRSRT